jgi:hypothetical protein
MHGKPVKMITVEWVEGPDGEPVGVERVVEEGVLIIPDKLRDDEQEAP